MYRSGLSSQGMGIDVKFGYSWPDKIVNVSFIVWDGIWFRMLFEEYTTSADIRVQAEPCRD
jgi:hypothetical protein